MARRPVSNELLRDLQLDQQADRMMFALGKDAGKSVDKMLAQAVSAATDAELVRRRPNLLDEPSSPGTHKKRTPNPKARFRIACEYATKITEGQWEPDRASHLVGLYAVLHQHVYGVLPLELEEQFLAACSSATALVKNDFAGDFAAAQAFIAWCWVREKRRAKRRSEGDEINRPGWRLQFKSRVWLVDYQADQHRRKK